MDEQARKKLWEQYDKTRSQDIRNQLIEEYAPLVKLVAGRLNAYLGFHVEYEDMVGYGCIGLIDAIDKFSLLKDVKFETYASLRIRGAILDQVRKLDWIPRTLRQKQKQINEAAKVVENQQGRTATDTEIAAQMGISEDEYLDIQGQMQVTSLISLNEFMDSGLDVKEDMNNPQSPFIMPETAVEKDELKQKLAESLDLLTAKEKQMILLYYYEDLTLKEIGNIMEITESRVSQLHTRALQKLNKALGEYAGIFAAVS